MLKRMRVATTRAAVHEVLGRYRRPLKAVLEASRSWRPLHDWLDEVAEEVALAHLGKVRAIAEARIKTDKTDSETLAHLRRADLIPAGSPVPAKAKPGTIAIEFWPLDPRARADLVVSAAGPSDLPLAAVYEARPTEAPPAEP